MDGNFTGSGGADGVFHLHCLEDAQRVAHARPIAGFDINRNDYAGDGSQHGATGRRRRYSVSVTWAGIELGWDGGYRISPG
jgi:hypothetical protein